MMYDTNADFPSALSSANFASIRDMGRPFVSVAVVCAIGARKSMGAVHFCKALRRFYAVFLDVRRWGDRAGATVKFDEKGLDHGV